MSRKFPSNAFVDPKHGKGRRLVVAESPGATEQEKGEPLVGESGQLFDKIAKCAGLKREDLTLVNILNCRPPDNIFPTTPEARAYISAAEGEQAVAHCYKAHVEPLLKGKDWQRIDLLGDVALNRIAGKDGIGTWRGSPLVVPALGGNPRAIATYHPSYLLRDQEMLQVAINDLEKSLEVPPERYNLFPTLEQVQAFKATSFAFDIETNYFKVGEDPFIHMVGLCASPYESIVVPFQGAYIKELRRIFRDAKSVIGHNIISFDLPVLRYANIRPSDDCILWDTLLLQHLRFPNLPHDLEFVGSQFSNKPAWKNEKSKAFQLYCARDTDVTLQIFTKILPLVREEGLLELYHKVQVPLAKICYMMFQTGFKVDPSQVGKVREQLLTEMTALELRLPEQLRSYDKPKNKRVDAPPGTLSAKTGKPVKFLLVPTTERKVPWRSPEAKAAYLYGKEEAWQLGLEEQLDLKTGNVTTGKLALDKLFRKTKNPTIPALKKLNQLDELVTTFANAELGGKARRVHPHFSVHGTASGRLSSSDPNCQNIPESARIIYVPSKPGWKIVDVDFSGIESRITAFLAKDKWRLEQLEKDKFFSEHKYLAAKMLGIPYDEVEKDNTPGSAYHNAKKVVHGCVTSDHEVLTKEGWVRFEDYDFITPIAEWDEGRIYFQSPLDYTVANWDGEMIQGRGVSVDFYATPDHKFCGRRGSNSPVYYEFEAGSLPPSARIPVTGQIDNLETGIVGNVRLAAAIQADSTLYGRHAVFHLHRPRKIERLKDLLVSSGITFSEADCRCNKLKPGVGVRIAFLYTGHPILTKKSFNSLILSLRRKEALELLEEILYWDGHKSGSIKSYSSTDLTSITWLQTLAHINGQQALLRLCADSKTHYGTKPVYKLSFNRRKEARLSCMKVSRHQFSGKVYCVTTTSGKFLIRHNDRIFVSGNSGYGLGAVKMSKMFDLDLKETKEFMAEWKKIIKDTVFWQGRTAEIAARDGVLTTPFGRKRWFYTSSLFTESLSFVPQSVAADIIFRCMIALMYERIGWPEEKVKEVVKVYKAIPEPINLLLQVHDALTFECPAEMVDRLALILKRVMEQPWAELQGFSIPIVISVGDSWGTLEKYSFS